MLRASSDHKQETVDLKAVIGQAAEDSGVAHGALLVAFAEAVIQGPAERLSALRDEIAAKMGPEALVDSAAVCALFNAIDRVADSTGIPLEAEKAAATVDMRAQLQIDGFR